MLGTAEKMLEKLIGGRLLPRQSSFREERSIVDVIMEAVNTVHRVEADIHYADDLCSF